MKQSIQRCTEETTAPAPSGRIADAFGSRLDKLSLDLEFCRALVDVLCFEKKSQATEESFATIKFRLWELVGEASSEAERLSTDLRDVVVEAMAVQS